MKKLLVLLMSFTLVLTLAGCDELGRTDPDPDPKPIEVDCVLDPEHEDCEDDNPVLCAPGYFEEDNACIEEITISDCDTGEMVVDNVCVVDPNYDWSNPVLDGPDYVDQGYAEYLGREIVNQDCAHLDNVGEWQPVWCDEFDYTGLPDSSLWSYDVGGHGWGNNELQYYTNADIDNAYVGNGVLTIEAMQESFGGKEYTSARLITKNKGEWTYGKIQIRAKVPGGKGTWPAAWLLPTDWEYGGWPDSGEIDVMEYVGVDPNILHSTIHTGAYNHSIGTQVGKSITLPNMESEFHVFEMEWEPNVIRYYVNGFNFYTVTYDPEDSFNVENWEAWPFDKDFHLLLNLAFGGNWGGYAGVDENLDNMKFEIDYVRVYQKDYEGMDTEAPSAVTNLEILTSNPSKTFVAWDVAVDDVMVEYYEVYINDVLLENSTHNGISIPAAIDTQVVKVIPVDFAGNKGLEQTITVDPPSAPVHTDRVEAESYVVISNAQTETCSDIGGGLNIGYIKSGSSMSYIIEVTEGGTFQIKARVASETLGGTFNFSKDGSVIATVSFSATGGWQSWDDAYSSTFDLTPGTYTFTIDATSAEWNINYFEFIEVN